MFSRRLQFIGGVIAHSDAGSQYVSVAYTERLAESVNGLYKTELIRRQGPWRNVEHVEFATLGRVEWFNSQPLHSELGDMPPAEFETDYYARTRAEARLKHPSQTHARYALTVARREVVVLVPRWISRRRGCCPRGRQCRVSRPRWRGGSGRRGRSSRVLL